MYRLVEPALRLKPAVRVVCVEGKPDRLLAELATHHLDLVLSDARAPVALARDIKSQYDAELVGRLDGLTERTYALTVERRLKHPAAVAISAGALALFK